jgi:hypothetical protein
MPLRSHPFSSDDLFRRVIEDEVDRLNPTLHPERRSACVQKIAERMSGEIEEHLAGADLSPELLIVRLREEIASFLGGEPPMLAA